MLVRRSKGKWDDRVWAVHNTIRLCASQANVQVKDLYVDLRDGQYLMLLLEMFTGEKVVCNRLGVRAGTGLMPASLTYA